MTDSNNNDKTTANTRIASESELDEDSTIEMNTEMAEESIVLDQSEDNDKTVLTNLKNEPEDEATLLTQQPSDENATILTEHSADVAKAETEVVDSKTSYTLTVNPIDNTKHKPFSIGGDAIKDRFIIKKVLGQGGMGMVCQALDLRRVEAEDDQNNIAIKLLKGAFQQHGSAFKSLQREAKKTQALAHPNIITVYDFDRDGDTIFMTMEELDGHPLDAIIKGQTDVEVDLPTAIKMVREIALALEYAHSKGIIHSDLKPGNIFYTKTGQTKVLDFGIARALNNELYKDNYDAGELNALTPKYASLEMFQAKDPDPSDDIYALGLIAGELISGAHPYGGKKAIEVVDQQLKPNINKSLSFLYRKLITKAVAVDRANRTKSATEFLSQLQWAEKGPRRLMVASMAIIILVIANAFLIEQVDDEIPFSDLTQDQQEKVLSHINSADTALRFQDYNGAIVYLQQAYTIHPDNDDVEDRAATVLVAFEKNLEKLSSNNDRQFLLEQLAEIGNYEFIANSDKYLDLKKQYQ